MYSRPPAPRPNTADLSSGLGTDEKAAVLGEGVNGGAVFWGTTVHSYKL